MRKTAMAPYLRYSYIGFALMAGIIATFVVAAVNPELRPGAPIVVLVLILAYLTIGIPRRIAWRRHIAELKAANGGALPIPNLARARRVYAIMISVFGGLGIAALITGAVIGGTEQLFLSILGASSLLVAAVLAYQGRRVFRERAAADRAAAEAAPTAD